MVVRHDVKQRLGQGESHTLPEQVHRLCRGYQVHVDITEHTDPDVLLAVDHLISDDGGETWSYGGGWTLRGGNHTRDKTGAPVTYVTTTWGRQPTPRQQNAQGEWIGEDPAPQRRVRTLVHVVHTPLSMLGVGIPTAPQSEAFGLSWKPNFLAGQHGAGGKSVATRVHLVGVREIYVDKALIPDQSKGPAAGETPL